MKESHVSMDAIKELREKTQAGFMDCKKALAEAKGDFDKAEQLLRKKGYEIALKKASRAARQGLVVSYVHTGGKIGVLLELNCETDFVARTEEFVKLAKDIAMQVASMNPKYVGKEEVPQEEILLAQEAAGAHKEEKTNAFYKELCLLEQPFIKDQSMTIKDYVSQAIGKVGENIVVRRFVRYCLGETEK